MQLNQPILAAERRAGLSAQPMVMWIETVNVNDDGTMPLTREGVVIWANGVWQLWEADASESEESFKARILAAARNGAPDPDEPEGQTCA